MESGLVNLRAELHKKRAEVNSLLSSKHGISERHQVKPFPSKSKEKKSSTSVSEKIEDEEEVERKNTLEKSKSVLEQKAALYDKLKKGTEVLQDDELNDKYLVNFQKKIEGKVVENKKKNGEKLQMVSQHALEALNPDDYRAVKAGEEWTEYVDSFGRTRICLQTDFDKMKRKEQIAKDAKVEEEIKEKFHKKWNEAELDTFKKDQIHYQDILYDEARTHGVGFMQFSRDEDERKKQHDELRNLRKETIEGELLKRENEKSKKKSMAERLAKVKQRKRLRLGLPCKDPREEKLKTPPPSDDESDDHQKIQRDVDEKLRKLDEERENEREAKAAKLRKWDIGKISASGSLLTQEQWIERKRKDRLDEFAPIKDPWSNKAQKTIHITGEEEAEIGGVETLSELPSSTFESLVSASESKNECKNAQFAPPSTYEYYGPSTKARLKGGSKNKNELENAISKGLANLRNSYNS